MIQLPVDDLRKKDGGIWDVHNINWKLSQLTNFQGQPAIRVFYGKNSGTSADPGIGGFTVNASPKGVFPAREVVVAFDAYFDRGFHFSKGGKFGGVFIGEGDASGFRHCPTASSHRIMWQQGGGVISYIYPPGDLAQEEPKLKAAGCGVGYFHDVFPAGTLKVGAWTTLVLGTKLNSFDAHGKPRADGVAMLQVNGKVAKLDNVRWTRSPDLRIESFRHETFFGGPDPSVRDCTAYYRNFRILDTKL